MDVKTVIASGLISSAIAFGAPIAVNYVNLQSSTPGVADTGHINITGYALASRVGVGISPTLARVQVNETGSAQGVRANTKSGVAISGNNTATSGLGAGGYFTSTSVGGRAVVAEQLSTTGSTVGGLFYNRSTSGGVAVWGKHTGTTGTTVGVKGEVDSQNGNAGDFENSSSQKSVELATGSNAVEANGDIKKKYGSNLQSCVPIAYGWIDLNGNVISGSGNFTASYNSTFKDYIITIAGEEYYFNTYTTVVTPDNEAVFSATESGSGNLQVYFYGTTGTQKQLSGSGFNFVTYKNIPSANPPRVPNHGYRTDGEWARKNPAAYREYMRRVEAANSSPN